MTNITTEQAETYLTAVEEALTAAGLRPAQLDLREYDECDQNGELVPSAVLVWPAEHPLVDTDTHDHGLLVSWSPVNGWEHASRREDGSNEEPRLFADDDAEPDALAAALLPIALGLPAHADRPTIYATLDRLSAGYRHWTPMTHLDACTCPTQPCGGITEANTRDICPEHRTRPVQRWHWAAACPAN